ncbi:DUF4439 domain-containing protein [Kineococcus sp. SYSU DK001]|uniref:DUF4439 domain-containing protein n=1 Tax=Kineococcus sp. SYSU DK001 TaxID=3383122 RepID=UPI003D7E1DE0
MPTAPAAPRRRTLLGSLLLAGAGLSGCGVRWVSGPEPTPTADPGPDDLARGAAVAGTRSLLDLLVPAASGPAPLRAAAEEGVRVCRAHLVALGADGTPAPSPTSPSAAPDAASDAAPDAQTVVDRLTAGATSALAAAAASPGAVSGGLARLLASIAASRAVLADAVATATGSAAGPVGLPPVAAAVASPTATGPADPAADEPADESTVGPLQAALAGEHAAVFAFGLVVARLAGPRRTEAAGDLAAHRVARDDLVDRITAAGATPVRSAPGYDVDAPTAEAALALAASVQERLTALYAAVAAGPTTERALGAAAVVTAARGARRWGSTVAAFPGLPGLTEDGSPAPTATP